MGDRETGRMRCSPALFALSFLLPSFAESLAPKSGTGSDLEWFFAFKMNTASYSGCSGKVSCIFGGDVQDYSYGYSLQYVSTQRSSGSTSKMSLSSKCLGSGEDPVAKTFAQVYDGTADNFVIWNDQFYQDPMPKVDPPCAWAGQPSNSCSAPWGHSKGVLAWDSKGNGFVMQVTTPDWPGNGNSSLPRKVQGNTLGCIKDDNAEVSQHFFATVLTADDTESILQALQTASVVTDPSNPQLVKLSSGPSSLATLARSLGKVSTGKTPFMKTLSAKGSGGPIKLLAKPSNLHVAPWQLVSSKVQSDLRVASWWTYPAIESEYGGTPGCWDSSLSDAKGVEIATTGSWNGKTLGLKGGLGTDFNHAKLGVSMNGSATLAIMGDMNQQGSFSPEDRICNSSQNGRGGLFFILDDTQLHSDMTSLLKGKSAPYPGHPTPTPTPTPSPPSPPGPPSPPSPPSPPAPGGACCYYSDSRCDKGQTCCTGSGKSYSESSCSKYGPKHHCKWDGSQCIIPK